MQFVPHHILRVAAKVWERKRGREEERKRGREEERKRGREDPAASARSGKGP
jgi:hypothetical protein